MKWENDYCNHINDFVNVECFEGEEWKDIYYTDMRTGEVIDYRGIYQVSNLGRLRRLHGKDRLGRVRQGHILVLHGTKTTGDYILHSLTNKEGRHRTYQVHRLVLNIFNPNEKSCDLVVNHIDENKQNNTLENLEWNTQKENINHGTAIKRRSEKKSCMILGKNLKTGEIVICKNRREASEKYSVNYSKIGEVINGKRNQTGGYKWYKLHYCIESTTKKVYESEEL